MFLVCMVHRLRCNNNQHIPTVSHINCNYRYQLITPLHSRHFEKPVLVNRGWVPATWRSDAEFRRQWESKGSDATLQAVTRVSEDPSSFVPQNNPKTGEWFWIDVPAMATSLDLPSDTPLVEVGLPSVLLCIAHQCYFALHKQRPYASDFPTLALDSFGNKRGWYLCLAAAFELSIFAAAHAAFELPVSHCVNLF